MVNRAYLRCSSDSQDVESQRHALQQWLALYGEGKPTVWYADEGVSGDEERPALAKLGNEARKGDTVLCWALDRVSREGIIPVLSAVRDFRQRGIRLVSITEPWADLNNNPCADVVIAVLAWAGEQEKQRILARQRAGIAAAKAAGRKWGGRKPGVMQKRTAELDATVRKMHQEGTPVAKIARLLKLTRTTVYRILGTSNVQ